MLKRTALINECEELGSASVWISALRFSIFMADELSSAQMNLFVYLPNLSAVEMKAKHFTFRSHKNRNLFR